MGQGQDLSIAAHVAAVDDPRVERTTHHSVIAILTIARCATICGSDRWVEVEEFGKAKRAWLSTFLELPHGIPAHDTCGRVFAALDPGQFAACFRSWVAGVHAATGVAAEVIAIDGKEARRSHDRGAGKAALRLVSAWATGARLVLAQRAVADKASELGAVTEVLGLLALEGCIVTIDAMGCHAPIAQAIVDGGGAYVLALKGNQGRLFADAQAVGVAGVAHDDHRAVDGGHGRVEISEAWAITDPAHLAYLDPKGVWPELRALSVVRAERRVGSQTSAETRYYLSGVGGPAPARALNRAVRSHWDIANGRHWVLDIAFREDECRVRAGHAVHNLAVLRHIALILLRRERTARVDLKAKRLKASWDHRYLRRVLAAA